VTVAAFGVLLLGAATVAYRRGCRRRVMPSATPAVSNVRVLAGPRPFDWERDA
jgi:hypothetical protein